MATNAFEMTEEAAAGPPSPLHASDEQLVRRARENDRSSIEELARRHFRAAFSVALAVSSNWADAEDIAQNALIRALARLEDCRSPERFEQWVCSIARNLAHNQLVHPYTRRRGALSPQTPVKQPGPALAAERGELQVKLGAALGELPAMQREVVLLFDLHDWSHELIAEHLGISVGMSRQHLFKGRRRLRELLGAQMLKHYFNE
jgi:RNA polymerase sigma-70 factor (ECF subfamily)